jgi:ADP-ribosylglycohydrolase
MTFQPDYAERVYTGVLGKIIGVYLGRPFEGWTYEQIMTNLGEIKYYVNDRNNLKLRNHHLVVTDDDISGTFSFIRALPDYGNLLELTPAQIGQTWLNYIIENRTILWWGGMGNSTEHTAFLRLKDGIPAPRSGSMELNGKVVSEQIGAQIFIEGWGLVAPGDPALAVDLARRAASVSHDGEAILGAQIIAAMVAQAFVEPDIDRLLDKALTFIPADSITARLIADLRAWHANDPRDWHAAREKLSRTYGYEKYGGNCHVIPNHGLVILSLLYSRGDFSLAQTIVNTCGWDTDCNAANVGCILGVRNGLAAFENGPDWRKPVADQMYIPTADGGASISDALREAYFILEIAHAIRGEGWEQPKAGARFHFSLPGSVQGFRAKENLVLENVDHPFEVGQRVLAFKYHMLPGQKGSAFSPVFIPPEARDMPDYSLLAAPTLYPGQTVHARLAAGAANPGKIRVCLLLEVYGDSDQLEYISSASQMLGPGLAANLDWQIPDLGGRSAAQIGVGVEAVEGEGKGVVFLDFLSWDGAPAVKFMRPGGHGEMWKRQWVNAADYFVDGFGEAFRVIQNRGRGLVMTGSRQWTAYAVQAVITPHMANAFGLAVRVQGQERYYALLLSGQNTVKLVKRLDGESVLAEAAFPWEYGKPYELELKVNGARLQASVNQTMLFTVEDQHLHLKNGGIALVCEAGRMGTEAVTVRPLTGSGF